MFRSARIRLTLWYVLIIALICVMFSLAFYKASTRELDRILHFENDRIERTQQFLPFLPAQIQEQATRAELTVSSIEDAKDHIVMILIIINGVVLLVTGSAGYFLAGRTLLPIKTMVDDQNRFITDASHELRTPLTSLKTSIEVYLRDKHHTVEESDILLHSNLEEVNNLQSLSDGLIKLTQYQKINGGYVLSQESLAMIVEDALKKVAPLAKDKNITISNDVGNDTVKANKPGLTEVFVILLDNAIKYSPRDTDITVGASRADHTIVATVADQGYGIEATALPYLFGRFYRADQSRTKAEVSGYGLGLAIAEQIVKKHHGSITVESIVNKGTIFSVHLPQK